MLERFSYKMKKKFPSCKLLIIGDIFVDKFIFGNSEDLSFEAPIPIIKVHQVKQKLGGSGTVIENALSLGATVHIIGFAGLGNTGTWLKNWFKKSKAKSNDFVFNNLLKTNLRTRVFTNKQQVARFDEYQEKIPSKTIQKIVLNLTKTIPKIDGIVISDYGLGAINDQIMKIVKEYSQRYKKKVIISSATHQENCRDESFVYRITIKEAKKLLKIHKSEPSIDVLCKKLQSVLKSKRIILTRGEQGLTAYENGTTHDVLATLHKARDVSSVGDILTATFAVWYCSGKNFVQSCIAGNVAGGIVVEKIGLKKIEYKELLAEINKFEELEFQK